MTKDLFINLESYEQTLICILDLNIFQCLQVPSIGMRSHNRIFLAVTQENFCGQETFAGVAICCEIFAQICRGIVD
jgi:hypothetical protein